MAFMAISVVAFVLSCVAITMFAIYRSDGESNDDEKRLQNIEGKTQEVSEIKPVDALKISNTDERYVADNAIDGDQNTAISTKSLPNPWWCADMGGIYHVKRVVITNILSEHDSVIERARNLRVGVTNMRPAVGESLAMDSYTLCGEKPGLMGKVGIVNCPDGVSGQYLIVQFKTTNHMNIAEVKIYGFEDTP